jgi:hypothetical protein
MASHPYFATVIRRAPLTERQILLDLAGLGEAAKAFLEAPTDTLNV